MRNYLDKLFILEGILLGIIGLFFFTKPISSLLTFATIFGIMIISIAIIKLIRVWSSESKFLDIAFCIIDILFAILLIAYPIASIENLILFYGIWALIRGVFNLFYSLKYHTFGLNLETLYYILSIILGLIIAMNPFVVLFALPFIPYLIGTYFIIAAIGEIYLGFKL